MPSRLSYLKMAADLIELLAAGLEFVALRELADDLFRRMPRALVRCHVVADSSCPNIGHQESHDDQTIPEGSPPISMAQIIPKEN